VSAICDLCGDKPGDHDKPYTFDEPITFEYRLLPNELRAANLLRLNVLDVQHGYPYGPAAGDIARDDDETFDAPNS
jgi:hypothetical protein